MNVTRIRNAAPNIANVSVNKKRKSWLRGNYLFCSLFITFPNSDCQNVDQNDNLLLEITKEETELQLPPPPPPPPQVAEESYVIENELPISCYTIPPKKKNLNVLTRDIIEATMECVINQAEECQRDNVSAQTAELLIVEEFGRCLEQIRRLSNLQNFLNWTGFNLFLFSIYLYFTFNSIVLVPGVLAVDTILLCFCSKANKITFTS